MAVVFDFSKESNDYRQRIAVVFKSLFERDFLENFDIVLEELFNGRYSIKSLKEAISKSKHVLLEGNVGRPLIEKKKENDRFANETIKMIILIMMLGEEYIKLKDILDGIETRDNIEDSLGVIKDIVDEIGKTKSSLKESLANTNFDIAQRNGVNDVLNNMDDVLVSCCFNLRMLVVDEILSLSDVEDDSRILGESIVHSISVIINGRERTRIF